MKNSVYLLIPKGISELLELSELSECVLTTEKEGQNPVLKYAFHEATEVSQESDRDTPRARHSKPAKVWQKARRQSPALPLSET
jgi:hypothetical protein